MTTMPRPAPPALEALISGAEHAGFAGAIAAAIDLEVERGAIGMARRSPELVAETLRRGDAVLVLDGREWAGFCYVASWDGGRFAATSGLIVRPEHRGRGVARLLKVKALELARRRYPGAAPFGLSTSEAIIHLNRSLGFRDAAYAELPRDEGFWKGCESCPFHAVLVANRRERCRCTAMLWEGSP
jgi:GNAT superfamily N-acetyltransferase